MKSLLPLVAVIALTTTPISVFAGGYQWINDSKSIQGNIVGNKTAAYDMGFKMIKDYQNKPSIQLRDEFKSAFETVDSQSFSITNIKVIVDEFLQPSGQIAYQAILKVKYEYRKREQGNS